MKRQPITWPRDNLFRGGAYHESPIWNWFGLTYSAYLCMPRLLLCGMPLEWQQRFVKLMEEADEHMSQNGIERTPTYSVQRRDASGRYFQDPWRMYKRGSIVECAKFDRELEERV